MRTAGAVVSLACDFNNTQYAAMYRHIDLSTRSRAAQRRPEHLSLITLSRCTLRWFIVLFVGIALCSALPPVYAQHYNTDLLLVSVVDAQGNIGSTVAQPIRLKRAPYVGIGAGRSFLEPSIRNAATVDIVDDAQTGVQLTLGLDINKHWSVELHSADLGTVELSDGSAIEYRESGLSALFYLGDDKVRYNRHGWTAYGRAGIGRLSNKVDGQVEVKKNEEMHLILGAGAERSTRRGFALRLETIAFDRDVSYFQLGLLYRLGRAPAWVSKLPGLGSRSAAIVEKRVRMSGKVNRTPTERDADGDGVLRSADKCPDTPSGIAVGENGCAVFNGVIDGLTFVSGSTQLTDEARLVLDSVARSLQQIPEARARVTAHTDSLGEATVNMRLSQQRALSVARYLVSKGIRKARLEARAFGEIRPIDTNATADGRRNNRRVEIDLIAE